MRRRGSRTPLTDGLWRCVGARHAQVERAEQMPSGGGQWRLFGGHPRRIGQWDAADEAEGNGKGDDLEATGMESRLDTHRGAREPTSVRQRTNDQCKGRCLPPLTPGSNHRSR